MSTSPALLWLVASALLLVLQWVPYIAQRAFLWGFGTFLQNYPEGFPAKEPEPPAWAVRAKRAHLNMVETFPAFAAVVLAAVTLGDPADTIGTAARIFFFSRVAYAVVYTLGLPFLRTPTYLVGWGTIVWIGVTLLGG